jgi:hypothetical protein
LCYCRCILVLRGNTPPKYGRGIIFLQFVIIKWLTLGTYIFRDLCLVYKMEDLSQYIRTLIIHTWACYIAYYWYMYPCFLMYMGFHFIFTHTHHLEFQSRVDPSMKIHKHVMQVVSLKKMMPMQSNGIIAKHSTQILSMCGELSF